MSETFIDKAPVAVIKNPDIERIIGMLPELSPERVKEIADFTAYLAERERKHKVFIEETLAAEERGEYYTFNTAEEAMEAIINWRE
ncbi:MAG: hypothetical protein HQK88_01990 [Nitrospirae bacterium]|nr:hypothetical protein [Nitrospirota bacterium]MBF0533723.1 hypothetical protein [Nitrospirota bacterium]MBF0615568.1 hypothetical protein [Nitrospirota bacterium]